MTEMELEASLKEAIQKASPSLNEKERKKQEEILIKFLLEGVPFQESLQLSKDAMEFIYSQGHRLYTTGKYQDALKTFHLLYILNSLDPRYSMGLGATYHMMKEYTAAITWYMVASFLDPSPLPYFYASDCAVQQKEEEHAFELLGKVIESCGKEKKYEELRSVAEQMRAKLKGEKSS